MPVLDLQGNEMENVLEKAIDQLMTMVKEKPDDARAIIRFLLTRFDINDATEVHKVNLKEVYGDKL